MRLAIRLDCLATKPMKDGRDMNPMKRSPSARRPALDERLAVGVEHAEVADQGSRSRR